MKLDRTLKATMTLSSGIATNSASSSTQNIPAKVAHVSDELLRSFPHSKCVGNYLLGRTLGEGSFAKVKEGLHTLTGEKVAIKVIDKKKARKDPYVRRNLRREGKLLQMVRHKNIVQLFEVMETENSYYLVTELCKGGDLMDRICNRRRLEEKETRRYIRQIISAIDHLHNAGVIHRDLKVENLLLDERKDIKIIDFGLSNIVRQNEVAGVGSSARAYCVTQCGSPAYAAPELLGNNNYGPQVDVWSIGVNMYAMLTGNLPFTVEPFNIKMLHSKMLKGDVNPLPDHLTNSCKDLLKCFLTADPEKRITLKDAMRHLWIIEGRNLQLEPAPFPNRLSADSLQHDIVKFMADDLGFNLGDVIRMVSNNTASSATATYHLLMLKLTRYNAERRSSGKSSLSDVRWMSANKNEKVISKEHVVGATTAAHKKPRVNAAQQKTTKVTPVTTEQPRILDLKQSPRKFAQKVTSPRQPIQVNGPPNVVHKDNDNNDSLTTHQCAIADTRGRQEDVLILRLAASHIDANPSKTTTVPEKVRNKSGAKPILKDRGTSRTTANAIVINTSRVTAADVKKASQTLQSQGASSDNNDLPSMARTIPDSGISRHSNDSGYATTDAASRIVDGVSNGHTTELHNGRLSPTPEDPSGQNERTEAVKTRTTGPMHFAIVPTGPCVVTERGDLIGTTTADPSTREVTSDTQHNGGPSRGWRGTKHNAGSRLSLKRPPMRRKLTLDMGNYDRYARSNSSGRILPTVQGNGGGDQKYPAARRMLDFVYPLGSRDAAAKMKLLANRQGACRTSRASSDGGKYAGGYDRRVGNARVIGLARHSIDSTPVSHPIVAISEVTQVGPLDGRSSPSSAGRSAMTPSSYTSKDSKVTLPTISHFTIGAKAHPQVEQE